jgi:WD40 repeat protein
VDASGSAYIVGSTMSADFPVTVNALQTRHGGVPDSGVSSVGAVRVYDAFVAKFSPDGSHLLYSTFFGGSGSDQGIAIALDASNNAVIAGFTGSHDFPLTAGAIQRTPTPFGTLGFVAKLKADGSDLIISSYLGSGGSTMVRGLALDSAGAVYIAGIDGSHGFVTKWNAAGTAQVYSIPIAGSGTDAVQAIAVSPAGNAWITGSTTSPDFPVTAGAAQSKLSGGPVDAFVTEWNAAGTAPLHSSYLGGSGTDIGYAIAVSSEGSVIVAGSTGSADFPVTTGAVQTALAAPSTGSYDASVVRLNSSGAVQYATLLGNRAGCG